MSTRIPIMGCLAVSVFLGGAKGCDAELPENVGETETPALETNEASAASSDSSVVTPKEAEESKTETEVGETSMFAGKKTGLFLELDLYRDLVPPGLLEAAEAGARKYVLEIRATPGITEEDITIGQPYQEYLYSLMGSETKVEECDLHDLIKDGWLFPLSDRRSMRRSWTGMIVAKLKKQNRIEMKTDKDWAAIGWGPPGATMYMAFEKEMGYWGKKYEKAILTTEQKEAGMPEFVFYRKPGQDIVDAEFYLSRRMARENEATIVEDGPIDKKKLEYTEVLDMVKEGLRRYIRNFEKTKDLQKKHEHLTPGEH